MVDVVTKDTIIEYGTNGNMRKRVKLPKTITIPAGIILSGAPSTMALHPDTYDLIIGIGNDHVARLIIEGDALRALKELDPEPHIS